jgi:phosphoribosylanthranilate isomerase
MCKIKICGLKTLDDIAIVNQYLPDYIGFNFVAASKRAIEPEQAKRLRLALNPKIKAVGVFQNAETAKIREIREAGVIDLIQLHGEEDQDYIDEIKKLGLPVIKAYKIKDNIPKILKSNYILLDSRQGGSGTSFDWKLINFDLNKTFLAGGINIDNIRQAKKLKPYCVDICSGAETNDKKDITKIKQLIKAVRNG